MRALSLIRGTVETAVSPLHTLKLLQMDGEDTDLRLARTES